MDRPPAPFEPGELLVLGDLEVKFQNDHAIVGELALEFIDLAKRASPLDFRTEFLHALDEQTAVPGAVEDGQLSVRRELRPETATGSGAGILPELSLTTEYTRTRRGSSRSVTRLIEPPLPAASGPFHHDDDGFLLLAKHELGIQKLELDTSSEGVYIPPVPVTLTGPDHRGGCVLWPCLESVQALLTGTERHGKPQARIIHVNSMICACGM